MRRAVLAALTAFLLFARASSAEAYCRRYTPAWTDGTGVRVVLHPDAQNFIRHVFVDPATQLPRFDKPCTSSSECGTDGYCATGYAGGANRCMGPRWTRDELILAIQWAGGRINNETPADIPFVYLDLNDTQTCQIDETCGDADRPWVNCFQSNTIMIMPTECDSTSIASADWTGVQWTTPTGSESRAKILRLRWSGNDGMPWEHTAGMDNAQNLGEILLHELGHGLGLGHVVNDYPAGNMYPYCLPNIPPGTSPVSLCLSGAMGVADTCPTMHGGAGEGLGLNKHFFGLDDIEGLVTLYGVDSAVDTRLYEDCDLSTPSFVELSTDDLPIITDMAAAPGLPLTSVSVLAIGGRFRHPNYTTQFRIWEWNWSTMASTLVASIDTTGFRSTGPLGVGMSPTVRALSTHALRLTNDSRQWRRQIRTVHRNIASGVETTATFDPTSGAGADTAVPGVSMAYHEPTSSWIHLIRDANGQVLLVARRPTGWSDPVPLGFRSFATPSIACSPTRCFIAFVEVPSPIPSALSQSTRLQWTEGTFAWPAGPTASFTLTAPVTTSWYNVMSDPVASVVQNPAGGWYHYVSTTYAQQNAGAWGTRVLTYRRTEGVTGTNALTMMTPLLAHSPGISVQPTAASTGVCAELFTSRSP